MEKQSDARHIDQQGRINIGTGNDDKMQPNAKRLLNLITGREAADEISKRRNPAFKITKGQKIGAFVTLRGKTQGRHVPKAASRQ